MLDFVFANEKKFCIAYDIKIFVFCVVNDINKKLHQRTRK